MTKTYCDLCKKESENITKLLDVVYNIHPHCGSEMKKNIDCCDVCLEKIIRRCGGLKIEGADLEAFLNIVR